MEVYDIETLRGMFLYVGYDVQDKKWCHFEVSRRRNDIHALVKHLVDGKIDYMISYNGLSFDMQVLQFILENHQKWIDFDNQRVVSIIYKFSQKVIDDTKYGLFPPYREEAFAIRQIDLFKVHHYDNDARGGGGRISLKWLEFTMDMPNVEDMPYHHSQEEFTDSELDNLISYCYNDVRSTHRFWLYTVGEIPDNEFYTGMNKIQDRLDLIEEMKFPYRAMNWSDVKIGDEINKKVYLKNTGLEEKDLKVLRETRKSNAGFTYGDCIPDYVEFKTQEFRDFHNRMKKVRVNLNEKEEYPFSYNKTNYLIAKGGIHSNERNRIIIREKGWILRDADIGSQYPHSIIKRGLFPSHLGKIWLIGYTGNRDRRLEYKPLAKKDKKFKGLSDMFKLALNGGGFGKTNDRSNWQYDPFVHFKCTIGNQFEILMLIESLEIAGIHVISANTDGIVCYFPEELDSTYYKICQEWEVKVGNNIQGKLEFTEYEKLIQSSVNDYLAIKTDGEVKKKGDFCTSFELHKNPSRRIIAIALEKYFVKGISVEETITSHNRIYDFCVGVKASKDYHYEANSKEGTNTYNRLVRYFVSTNGSKLFKVKNEGSESEGASRSQCEAGSWKCTIANEIQETKAIKDYHIDYSYYIQKAKERILSLESGRKVKGIDNNPNQTSLF
jgi:hypothetical protein